MGVAHDDRAVPAARHGERRVRRAGERERRQRAVGHSDVTGRRVPSKGDNTPALGPAGTVHASLADWAKFIRLHLDGAEGSLTLSPAALTRLHTQHPTTAMYPARYGWGWGMWDDVGGLGLGHDGSNGLWYCQCQVVTGRDIAFLAVANIGGGEGVGDNGNGDTACWKLIEHLRDRYLSS
ncbi:serine hydrolase [Saccharothrix saharensis]|uniref:serine hydrolase n=1 Tax=Saccharothrix saharensis TaxID=571190 RepID=UPI0036A74A97